MDGGEAPGSAAAACFHWRLHCCPLTTQSVAPQQVDRNALRVIISECLDPSAPSYCSKCPTPIQGACGVTSCMDSLEVWGETPEFVAIRDRKMCGCPPGFVHGLAIPRTRVTASRIHADPSPSGASRGRSRLRVSATLMR
jgi:hypothetical protein